MIAIILTALLLVSFGILVLITHLPSPFITDVVGKIVAGMFIVHALVALLVFEILPPEYKYIDSLGPFGFSYGPLFYFSIRYSTERKRDFYKRLALHGIPFFCAVLFYFVYCFSPSLREHLGRKIITVWYISLCISWFVYLLLIIFLFVKKKVNKKAYRFSSKAFIFYAFIISFIALTVWANFGSSERPPSEPASLVVFTFMLIHALLGYTSLLIRLKEEGGKQIYGQALFPSKILDTLEREIKIELREEKQSLEVGLILLNEDGDLLGKINFLDSENTLVKQASLFDMLPNDLSRKVREETGLSYTNYINKQRIDHAVALLVKDKEIDMDELMQASGFSSKSSFYRNFKKFTDHSPLEYIQQVLK